jgi:hypothetical protein
LSKNKPIINKEGTMRYQAWAKIAHTDRLISIIGTIGEIRSIVSKIPGFVRIVSYKRLG